MEDVPPETALLLFIDAENRTDSDFNIQPPQPTSLIEFMRTFSVTSFNMTGFAIYLLAVSSQNKLFIAEGNETSGW